MSSSATSLSSSTTDSIKVISRLYPESQKHQLKSHRCRRCGDLSNVVLPCHDNIRESFVAESEVVLDDGTFMCKECWTAQCCTTCKERLKAADSDLCPVCDEFQRANPLDQRELYGNDGPEPCSACAIPISMTDGGIMVDTKWFCPDCNPRMPMCDVDGCGNHAHEGRDGCCATHYIRCKIDGCKKSATKGGYQGYCRDCHVPPSPEPECPLSPNLIPHFSASSSSSSSSSLSSSAYTSPLASSSKSSPPGAPSKRPKSKARTTASEEDTDNKEVARARKRKADDEAGEEKEAKAEVDPSRQPPSILHKTDASVIKTRDPDRHVRWKGVEDLAQLAVGQQPQFDAKRVRDLLLNSAETPEQFKRTKAELFDTKAPESDESKAIDVCILYGGRDTIQFDDLKPYALTTIGCDPFNDIRIEGRGISRFHLGIVFWPAMHTVAIFDFASSNGTWINDRRLAMNQETGRCNVARVDSRQHIELDFVYEDKVHPVAKLVFN